MKKSLIEAKDNSTLTKNGSIRKRRVFKMSLKERLDKKVQLLQEMHPVRNACQHEHCHKNIPQERRVEINKEFWQMWLREIISAYKRFPAEASSAD